LIEASRFAHLIPPTAKELATSITDSLTHYLNALQGQHRLASMTYKLTLVVVDLLSYTYGIKLSTKGPEGTGVLSLGNEDFAFTDNRRVVLSLSYPLPLLYATS
jgi:hypothetical protein